MQEIQRSLKLFSSEFRGHKGVTFAKDFDSSAIDSTHAKTVVSQFHPTRSKAFQAALARFSVRSIGRFP